MAQAQATSLAVNFKAHGPPTAARLATPAEDGFLHITADSWYSQVIAELVSDPGKTSSNLLIPDFVWLAFTLWLF